MHETFSFQVHRPKTMIFSNVSKVRASSATIRSNNLLKIARIIIKNNRTTSNQYYLFEIPFPHSSESYHRKISSSLPPELFLLYCCVYLSFWEFCDGDDHRTFWCFRHNSSLTHSRLSWLLVKRSSTRVNKKHVRLPMDEIGGVHQFLMDF